MNRLHWMVLTVALGAAMLGCQHRTSWGQGAQRPGWKLVWADEFDKVAELIVDVLANTTATTTAAGTPGKAKYTLADGVADRTKAASAELLDANPLYPGLDVS